MSNKITDAHIAELEKLSETLTERKNKLVEKTKKRRDQIREIRDAMEHGETAGIILAVSDFQREP